MLIYLISDTISTGLVYAIPAWAGDAVSLVGTHRLLLFLSESASGSIITRLASSYEVVAAPASGLLIKSPFILAPIQFSFVASYSNASSTSSSGFTTA